jgi:hypothetical protein
VKIKSNGCVIVSEGDEKSASVCEFEPEYIEELTEPSSLLPFAYSVSTG